MIIRAPSLLNRQALYQAQLMSYLRMTKLELGLLINFNVPVLKYGIKRVILST
jgi:GxxExxY protein